MHFYKSLRKTSGLAFGLFWCALFLALPAATAQDEAATKTGDSIVGVAEPGKTAFDASQFTLSIKDWIQLSPRIAVAVDSLQQGDVAAATKELVTAVSDNPDLPQAEILMAEYYFAQNQKPSGFASLEQAIKSFPKDPEPYLVLGNLAFNEKRFTDARLLFEKAATMYDDLQASPAKKQRIALGMYAGLSLIEENAKSVERNDSASPEMAED